MSLSNCGKCWDTPCTCGFDLLHNSPEHLMEQALLLTDLADFVGTFGGTTSGQTYRVREAHFDKFLKWRSEHRKR